ncbi:MAG: glycoside hydrolase family 2 protein [Armatimonadota bacterium]
MKTQYDLSQLSWNLAGWIPESWRMQPDNEELNASPYSEAATIPAKVPGSVQYSLLQAGRIPDWNVKMNALACEWVENRHWIYEAKIPDAWISEGMTFRLNCLGLDNAGYVFLNGKPIGEFRGAYHPHVFDLTPLIREQNNILRIIFDMPPKWLGYTGFTSRFTEWKARFSYSWDWMIRFVPIGIWDDIFLEVTDGMEFADFTCVADADVPTSTGSLKLRGRIDAREAEVKVSLTKDGQTIREESLSSAQFTAAGLSWTGLPVDLWWPNLEGDQPLYTVTCTLFGSDGSKQDEVARRVGFKNVTWLQNEGAPDEADPWVCAINGRPVFLQGVNWTPIRPNFADLTEEDYRKRLEIYKDMGLTIFRVWGGAILEKEVFYNLCDEMGLMVWQEFSFSSSSFENWPPEDPKAIREMRGIAKSYVTRRQHHASLIMWCGGNELHKKVNLENGEIMGVAADLNHPMLAMLKEVVEEYDPTRRFVATSPSGPRVGVDPREYGQGLHWDVHGPWAAEADLSKWEEYWAGDDSLFRSEVGAPSASPMHILKQYAADEGFVKPTADTPEWHRQFDWWWWAEWPKFAELNGREPESIEEFVEWSLKRQADSLRIAAKACKDRFPGCGGFIVWMSQDSFPCTANTAILDFHGDPKPSVFALKEVFRG